MSWRHARLVSSTTCNGSPHRAQLACASYRTLLYVLTSGRMTIFSPSPASTSRTVWINYGAVETDKFLCPASRGNSSSYRGIFPLPSRLKSLCMGRIYTLPVPTCKISSRSVLLKLTHIRLSRSSRLGPFHEYTILNSRYIYSSLSHSLSHTCMNSKSSHLLELLQLVIHHHLGHIISSWYMILILPN